MPNRKPAAKRQARSSRAPKKARVDRGMGGPDELCSAGGEGASPLLRLRLLWLGRRVIHRVAPEIERVRCVLVGGGGDRLERHGHGGREGEGRGAGREGQ